MEAGQSHPYVPRDLKLPGYVPCFLSQAEILAPYLGCSVLVVGAMWLLSGRIGKITKIDRVLMCWWIFTGLTHIILEGYFAFVPEFYKVNTPHYLAEVCLLPACVTLYQGSLEPGGKEYSKGDSRYVGRDPGVVTVEGITAALEGPACLLAVYAIATKKSYSYILQFAVCLGQLYGCLVYFITAYLQGDNFSTNEFYYWAYYIGANCWWVLIPSLIAIRAWNKICAACQPDKKKKNT